jgi:hypothetical protein
MKSDCAQRGSHAPNVEPLLAGLRRRKFALDTLICAVEEYFEVCVCGKGFTSEKSHQLLLVGGAENRTDYDAPADS